MSKTIYIGGRLESKEKGNVVTGANAILDDTKGKKQNVINKETDDELARLEQSKQDNLTFDNAPTEDSTNPVTSGGVYTAEKALSDAIEAILLLIPSAATALNKLVDTNTMNSSISTATATFRGTYNAVSDLGLTYQATHAQIEAALDALGLTADNNDFAFVQIPVSDQSQDIAKTERFKFNGTNWLYEYDLNTSGFTAAQWAAINSTITLALVQKLAALPTNAELLQALGLKQDVLTFDNAPTTDSNNPVKSGGIKNAIDTAVGDEATARENADTALYGLIGDEKTRAEGVEGGLDTRLGAVEGSVSTIQGVIPSEATTSNKLVDNLSMTTYIGTIIDNIDATFNVTSTDGHVTLAITQVNGVITSVQLTTSDIASAAALNLKASQADLTALAGRVTTAEGNITSLTGRMTTAEGDIDTLTDLYNALQQSAPQVIQPTDTWPVANPSTTVIYRVIDRVNTPPEYYSDYMWNGTSMVLMATYNNAVDTTPKKDSANLITSGGVFANIGAFDISEYHKSGSTLATYADLTAALAAIPSDYQKGGMSIKFVQSSDNKYIQARCMAQNFTTDVTQWQGVDDEPIEGSENLIKSGGVYKDIYGSLQQISLESNITYGLIKRNSDNTCRIDYIPNGHARLAFFPVTGGKKYKIHVPLTRTYCYVYGFTNTLLISDITENVELGGVIGSDSYIGGTEVEYNNIDTVPSGLNYMVISYSDDGDIPTLQEIVASDVVLYQEQSGKTEEEKQIARNNIGAYPQSNGDLLEEKVEDIKTTLDYNLSSDNITPDVSQSENILPSGVAFLANSNFVTDYIKVKKDDIIKVTSFSQRYTGFCQTIPVLNAACIDSKEYSSDAELLNAEIVSPIDGYFTLGRLKTDSETVFVIIDKGLQVQINEIANNTDYNTFFPKYLYDVDNAERQTLQRIRIESLIDERLRLDINKGNGFLVHKLGSNTSTVETQTRDISLGLGNVEHKQGSINIVTTKASAITGKLVKYLAIGDSWCATNAEKDLHGNTATPWNYECAALNDFIKTQIDLNDETSKMISIGFSSNSNIPDRTLTYKGQSYTLRSRNEGRGGWNAQTYLRHPVNVRQPGAGDMNGKVAWDAIGLGRKQPYGGTYDESATYTDYTGSTAQITEYLTTAMGYYHWDYSTELMNWLGITGTYSGTVEQKTAIDDAMVEMLNYRYQGNPFFDWDTAINSHGAYAFSLAKYLERFKTREEDGVTPLVIGETAGTRVTYQSQINDYPVCTPTHVTIELGINDWGGLSINQRASDIEMIAQLIHAHEPNIKVGIVQVHIPGSFYPSVYSGDGMFKPISDWHIGNYTKPLFNLNKKLSDDVNNYQGVSGVYYVPTYFVEGNLSSGASYQEDAVGNELLLDGIDELHASLNEHLEIGSQIFSWLVYTLSQS